MPTNARTVGLYLGIPLLIGAASYYWRVRQSSVSEARAQASSSSEKPAQAPAVEPTAADHASSNGCSNPDNCCKTRKDDSPAKQVSSGGGCCSGKNAEPAAGEEEEASDEPVPLRILYATQTGAAKRFAGEIAKDVFAMNVSGFHFDTSVDDLVTYDQDNLVLERVVIFLIPTWTDGKPSPGGEIFFEWLLDLVNDFRVDRDHLKNIRYTIFGLGNSLYDENFCKAATTLDGYMQALGAKRCYSVGKGDDLEDQEGQFKIWKEGMLPALCHIYQKSEDPMPVAPEPAAPAGEKPERLSQKQYRRNKRLAAKASTDYQEEDRINDTLVSDSDEEEASPQEPDVTDLEDMGEVMAASKKNQKLDAAGIPREMVTPLQRRALTKEGYRIIGTHSAVKLCRWTKHQLRGRGGCYKHTMYGINSYQCMETTPSLACANKCVFCWRHHKNPVGREWRWKTDSPGMIVENAMKQHCQMINMMKGVPGVLMDRWEAAFNIKHCALSLVRSCLVCFRTHAHERTVRLVSRSCTRTSTSSASCFIMKGFPRSW